MKKNLFILFFSVLIISGCKTYERGADGKTYERITVQIPCDKCNATGHLSDTCLHCNGNTKVQGPCNACGGQKIVQVLTPQGPRVIACQKCQGQGWLIYPCPHCDGTGKMICAVCRGRGTVDEIKRIPVEK